MTTPDLNCGSSNTSQLEKVLTHIQKNEDTFIDRLMDYVRHPSISAENIGVREVAELLVGMLSKLGFEAESVPTSGHPMVVGHWHHAPGAPTMLLYGHYDVQPADPLSAWTDPPFEPAIREGRIYARGVGDNKGQHFAHIMAIESYLAVAGTLPCNVIFLLEGEEEVGSPHISEFVRENGDRLKADLAVTSDGSLHASGQPTMTFGVRGIASFELRANGAHRDLHSGNFGGLAPNPIWTLVQLLATMKNAAGEITIEGFHDGVISPSPRERAAAAALPMHADDVRRELSLTTLDVPADRPVADRLMFHPTLTINGLHGGYGGPKSKTIIPCEAVAKCDARLVHGQTPDDILNKIAAHVRRHAPDVEFIPLGGMLPSKTSMESPFASPLSLAVEIGHGAKPLLYPSLGGSLPDYVFTKHLGIDSFIIPYANHDQSNHAPNENLRIDCFLRGVRTSAAFLFQLGQARHPGS